MENGDWVFKDSQWKWNGSTPMGSSIIGFTLHGGRLSNTVAVVPGTEYIFRVAITECTGKGQVGLCWSGPGGVLQKQPCKQPLVLGSNVVTSVCVAPWDARWGTLWIRTGPGACAKILGASFGPKPAGEITVDASTYLRGDELKPSAVGINCNYLVDDKDRRSGGGASPINYVDALRGMNVGALRYPGGEKSDAYLWARGPDFTGPPDPQLSRVSSLDWPSNDPTFYDRARGSWQTRIMDFDSFMAVAGDAKLHAEPYLVLNWDGCRKDSTAEADAFVTSSQDLKEAAVGWARYCAEHYPHVQWFEFSNESYISHMGAGALASDYVEHLRWFAKDLKAANPRLRLGANGPNNAMEAGELDCLAERAQVKGRKPLQPWWKTILQEGSEDIDFLCIHPYVIASWDYNDYAAGAINLAYPVQEANWAIDNWAAADRRDEMGIAVTETAPIDYGHPPWDCRRGPKWRWQPATLGHALVLLDQIASLLMHPRVQTVMFWNTRWLTNNLEDTQCWENSVVDALHCHNNTLTTCGKAVSFAGAFFRNGRPVHATSTQKVRCWALRTTGGLRIVLLNKSKRDKVKQVIKIRGFKSTTLPTAANESLFRFMGKYADDPNPGWVVPFPSSDWRVEGGACADDPDRCYITLPPLSVTAIELVSRV